MAKERRSLRKSVEFSKGNGVVLYFNKNCEVGKIINEHLLPDNFQETSLKSIFKACVELLLGANIDSIKFSTALIRSVGDHYGDVEVKSRLHLRMLLQKLCEACGACENFIGEKKIEKCGVCDEDSDDDDDLDVDEPVIKKIKNDAPNQQTTVVFDKRRVSILLKRMDLSEMAASSEITLPPHLQKDTEKNNNRFDSVTSTPHIANEATDTVHVLETTSSSEMTTQKVNVVIANSMQNEIALRPSCSTFVTVQTNQNSTNVSDHNYFDKGDWSMAIPATPITSRTVTTQSPISVEELIEILQDPAPPSPAPEVSNVIENHIIDENAMEDDIIIMDQLNEMFQKENAGAGGIGVESNSAGGDQQEDIVQLESISIHSGSDNEDDANEDPVANNAESDNESRAYDTQDEMEQIDDVFSGTGVSYVRVDWTPDQLAEFILEEDTTLEKFALFIRNERIDGTQVPFISYDVIKDAAITTAMGENLRFLKAVEKWKKLFNSTEKDLNSTLSQSATETA